MNIPQEILNRKGARKADDIPSEVLELLNKGAIETANLTEWLAVNQFKLIDNTFPSLGLEKYIEDVKESINQLKKITTMSTVKVVGEMLYELASEEGQLQKVLDALSNHKSDTIRCYATYLISLNTKLSIKKKLENSKRLIADKHFGIREIVWMALRPEIEKDLKNSIALLAEFTKDKDENIRRFATEVCRPRGVWCKHIESLKNKPEQALVLLENLKADKALYVQNSVANWLNDASKSQAKFVVDLCNKWKEDSPTKETEKIIKRALRTINKK